MYACRYFNQQLHMTVVLTKGQLDTIIHLLKQFLSCQIKYSINFHEYFQSMLEKTPFYINLLRLATIKFIMFILEQLL